MHGLIPSPSAPVTSPPTVPATPIAWDAELRGAQYLLRSGLCPPGLKSAEAVLYVILAGRDLGLSPVASLRGLTVIQGRLEVSADLQLALFHRAGGRSQWVTLTDECAALRLTAPWLLQPHTASFSIEDARRAGIYSETYRRYPRAMLRARAITAGLKDIGFEPTAGLYAPGELLGEARAIEAGEQEQPEPEADPTPAEPPAAAPAAPRPEPPHDDDAMATLDEIRALKRAARDAGIDSPRGWSALLADLLGPDWSSTPFTRRHLRLVRARLDEQFADLPRDDNGDDALTPA